MPLVAVDLEIARIHPAALSAGITLSLSAGGKIETEREITNSTMAMMRPTSGVMSSPTRARPITTTEWPSNCPAQARA